MSCVVQMRIEHVRAMIKYNLGKWERNAEELGRLLYIYCFLSTKWIIRRISFLAHMLAVSMSHIVIFGKKPIPATSKKTYGVGNEHTTPE